MTSLHELSFKIIIPNSDAFDSIGGIQQDNTAFTRSIKDLWALLKSIEDKCRMPQALKFRLRLSAEPSDPVRHFRNLPLDFVNDWNLEEVDQPNGFDEISNRLPFELMRIPQDLRPLPWVDGFSVVETSRGIHSAALKRLASRFQGLTYLEVHLTEGSTQTRSDVAREISNLSLPRLSELVFNLDFSFLKKTSCSTDAFSTALHGLLKSPNLLKVTLGVRFTAELFWPRLEEFGGRQNPFWPCLQSITVITRPYAPDGTYLLIAQHLIGELPCVRLDMSMVNPLLLAAARAAQHMPNLLEMKVRIRGGGMGDWLGEMAFAAQGYCSEEDTKGDHAALRLHGLISSGSPKLVLLSDQLDLSKPRVSVVMPSRCTVDGRLAQVWKASKGEDVDYKVGYGCVPYENDYDEDYYYTDDYDDDDNDDDD